MPLATVARFNGTPVKSTALHHPDSIDLRRDGAVGDRRFLFARSDGTRLHGISKAPLMPIVSTWSVADERLTMRFPDGSSAEGSALPVGERVDIKLFDRSVPARAIDPAFTETVRRVVVDETLSVFRVDEPEFAGGGHRASIISLASVADVGSRGGDVRLDPRRFRMPDRTRWGGGLRGGWMAGSTSPCRWCRPPSRAADASVRDDEPGTGHRRERLRHAQGAGAAPDGRQELLLGIYGDVVRPGRIEVGDAAEFAD
jgi:uncharacterized protein YcbX